MKALTAIALLASALSAQTPAPPKPQNAPAKPPAAKPAAASEPENEVAGNVVVAVVNGKEMTAAEVRNMLAATPEAYLRAFPQNPGQFMREYAWYMYLKADAEKKGLDQKTPYKERLEFHRMLTLATAQHEEVRTEVVVSREQEEAHYNANKDKYREAFAKLIYISFASDPAPAKGPGGKPVLSEAQAKAKAESIVKQARSGTDFVKLVKEHSEDPGSVPQNGDIGTGIRSTSEHIPETMRKAILALKPGEISDAVRHENGYYVFRLESTSVLPFENIRGEIYNELQQAGFLQWVKKTQAESSVKIANEEFFRKLGQTIQQQSK